MLERLYAFFLGMKEYRSAFTTAVQFPLERTYDRGRDFAHALTFRRFEH